MARADGLPARPVATRSTEPIRGGGSLTGQTDPTSAGAHRMGSDEPARHNPDRHLPHRHLPDRRHADRRHADTRDPHTDPTRARHLPDSAGRHPMVSDLAPGLLPRSTPIRAPRNRAAVQPHSAGDRPSSHPTPSHPAPPTALDGGRAPRTPTVSRSNFPLPTGGRHRARRGVAAPARSTPGRMLPCATRRLPTALAIRERHPGEARANRLPPRRARPVPALPAPAHPTAAASPRTPRPAPTMAPAHSATPHRASAVQRPNPTCHRSTHLPALAADRPPDPAASAPDSGAGAWWPSSRWPSWCAPDSPGTA